VNFQSILFSFDRKIFELFAGRIAHKLFIVFGVISKRLPHSFSRRTLAGVYSLLQGIIYPSSESIYHEMSAKNAKPIDNDLFEQYYSKY
jgi:hypothetical protein